MIQEKDVDILIKAKRDGLAINVLQGLSFLSLTTLIVLEASSIEHNYTVLLATMAAVFMGGALGQSKWIAVPRSQLLQALERIINSDSEALKLLAEKRKSGVSVNKRT